MAKKKLFKALLVLLCAAFVCISCKEKPVPCFVQISDPQLGFITKDGNFQPEVELMEKIIGQVNALEADFVVFSGDLVHWRTDSCAVEAFGQLLDQFNKKVYCLPGNHDVGNEASAEDVAAFVERYGSDRFVHKAESYTVIGYNSCVVKAQTPAEAAEYQWLAEQLAAADKGKPIIVVAHHPIFLNLPDEPETYENFPIELRSKYLQLLEQHGADLYLAGHLHKCNRAEYGGMQMVTASAAGRQLGRDKPGYSIICFEGEVPSVEYLLAEPETPNAATSTTATHGATKNE